MAKISGGYARTQIALHWAIALLILLQFLGGDYITSFVEKVGITASSASDIPVLVNFHVVVGSLTLALMVLRLALRFILGAPELPAGEDPRMKLAAHATHIILYVALFLAPLSGLVAWFGQVELGIWVHNALTTVLAAFVYLHIAAALYHQFILKNGLIKRMVRAG